MPEFTRDQRMEAMRARVTAKDGPWKDNPFFRALMETANFDRMSHADLVDLERRAGGRVS